MAAPVGGPSLEESDGTTSLSSCVKIAEDGAFKNRSPKFTNIIVVYQEDGKSVSQAALTFSGGYQVPEYMVVWT